MADFNEITLIGRLGKDAEIRTTQSSKEVASFSIATDDGWKDKDSGDWVKSTNWHNIVTFQSGLINIIKTRGKKGALVFIKGKMTYRTWRKDGEQTDRREAEVKLEPGSTLNFLDPVKASAE